MFVYTHIVRMISIPRLDLQGAHPLPQVVPWTHLRYETLMFKLNPDASEWIPASVSEPLMFKLNPDASEWIPASVSELEDVLREQRLGLFYRNRLKKIQRAERTANEMREFLSDLDQIMKSLPDAATISKQDQWLHPSKIQADAWFSFVRHKYRKPLLKRLHEWLADAQGKRCAAHRER